MRYILQPDHLVKERLFPRWCRFQSLLGPRLYSIKATHQMSLSSLVALKRSLGTMGTNVDLRDLQPPFKADQMLTHRIVFYLLLNLLWYRKTIPWIMAH